MDSLKKTPGRGASSNPDIRFESTQYRLDVEGYLNPEEQGTLKTQFFKDHSKTILTENKSPDIGFRFSVNAYRGCEHGCAYCYARPTHEYLGMSAGLDFESKIFVKEEAPELLRKKLLSPSWKPEPIAMSGVTDCYQPVERKFQLTRRCLQVLAEFKNPALLITKNALVTRDIDVLKELAQVNAAMVFLSITSLDPALTGILEPRTSRPAARLEALRQLSEAGIPVGVLVAPIIPALNDHEVPAILAAATQAGAKHASYTLLRLPLTVEQVFLEWLERHKPDRKERILNHIRSMKGGRLNDSRLGHRMRGEGPFADNLRQLFKLYARKEGLNQTELTLATEHFKRPPQPGDQLGLF